MLPPSGPAVGFALGQQVCTTSGGLAPSVDLSHMSTGHACCFCELPSPSPPDNALLVPLLVPLPVPVLVALLAPPLGKLCVCPWIGCLMVTTHDVQSYPEQSVPTRPKLVVH